MLSIPFATLIIAVFLAWHYDPKDKNVILVVLMGFLFGTIAIGRIWNKFFEGKKYGRQKKLDGFLKPAET